MAKRITVHARKELLRAIGERYREGTRKEKLAILDEFVAVTGYHRKHAIRMLGAAAVVGAAERTVSLRPRLYDEAVREALVVFWEASDRVCGKRLKPLLSILLPALERHGHLRLDAAVRDKVFSVSAATIDRMLAPTRGSIAGNRTQRRAKPGIRRSIPVRTFADWNDPLPGFMEADLVCHGGETSAGSFAHTLVLTDIASGWAECIALAVREGSLIVEALAQLRATMPFPLRGFDTDNGGEFINDAVLAYCTESGIEFTRSRPYRKNDQAWVEQKEWLRRPASGRLSTSRGHRRGRGARAPVCGVSALRELLSTFLQARRKDAPGSPCQKAVSRATNSVCTTPGIRGGARRDERAAAGDFRHARSTSSSRGDQGGAKSSRRSCIGRHAAHPAAARRRSRWLSEEPGFRLARRRGASYPSRETDARTGLAHAKRSIRSRMAASTSVVRCRPRPDGKGALSAPPSRTAGEVPRRAAPNLPTQGQGMAECRRPQARLRGLPQRRRCQPLCPRFIGIHRRVPKLRVSPSSTRMSVGAAHVSGTVFRTSRDCYCLFV
jgi:hypothetical protein